MIFPTQWPHLMIHTRAVAGGADRNALAVVDLKGVKGRVQLVQREGRNLGHPDAIRQGNDFLILAKMRPPQWLKLEFFDTSKLGHDGT